MPTISGLRRRGYPPEALQEFVKLAGVAKRENIIEASFRALIDSIEYKLMKEKAEPLH